MAATGMFPAHPPLPTCSYFPFQPEAGSQTSNWISESLVGRAVAFTTQCAGRFAASATVVAEVTAAWASFRPVNCSHAPCAAAGPAHDVRQTTNPRSNECFGMRHILAEFVRLGLVLRRPSDRILCCADRILCCAKFFDSHPQARYASPYVASGIAGGRELVRRACRRKPAVH